MTSPNHHFIPSFILRNFALEAQAPAGPSPLPKAKEKSRGDILVNKIDLPNAQLAQKRISTENALVDLYRDAGFNENPNHLEEKLSHLEHEANEILNKACDFFSRNEVLELPRPERDTLRKFLFLLKYRSTSFFTRYNHDSIETYDPDDQPRLSAYMHKKGLTKPRDIWFDNLRGLLDIRLDDGNWAQKIVNDIYPDDAALFILHVQGSFLSFCTPESVDEEFILTQNAYSIFEGPSNPSVSPSGKIRPGFHTEYHTFAPISPRLMIILRSNLLREDDPTSPSREFREKLLSNIRNQHPQHDQAGSILQDLPVRVSRNSYTSVDGTPTVGLWKPLPEHRFYFTCFKLERKHVGIINGLFLGEACFTEGIIYRSPFALRTLLEGYLGDAAGLRVPSVQESYLRTLESVLSDLQGMTAVKSTSEHVTHVATNVGIELLSNNRDNERWVPEAYTLFKPDGNEQSFWYDIHQARRMVTLRTTIDAILDSSSLNESDKEYVRMNLNTFLASFPLARRWLYTKIYRNLTRFDDDLEIEGAEDTQFVQ